MVNIGFQKVRKYLELGVLEYWSVGITKENTNPSSITPALQYSSTPISMKILRLRLINLFTAEPLILQILHLQQFSEFKKIIRTGPDGKNQGPPQKEISDRLGLKPPKGIMD